MFPIYRVPIHRGSIHIHIYIYIGPVYKVIYTGPGCNKAFALESELVSHAMIHCAHPGCQRSFKILANLLKHVAKHDATAVCCSGHVATELGGICDCNKKLLRRTWEDKMRQQTALDLAESPHTCQHPGCIWWRDQPTVDGEAPRTCMLLQVLDVCVDARSGLAQHPLDKVSQQAVLHLAESTPTVVLQSSDVCAGAEVPTSSRKRPASSLGGSSLARRVRICTSRPASSVAPRWNLDVGHFD